MGEIADMMLECDLCGGCSGYIPGKGQGFQRFCADCKRDGREQVVAKPKHPVAPWNTKCDLCGKTVRKLGVTQHKKDVHPDGASHGK